MLCVLRVCYFVLCVFFVCVLLCVCVPAVASFLCGFVVVSLFFCYVVVGVCALCV